MVECMLHMHVLIKIVSNFGTKFLLRRGECKTRGIAISGIRANRNFNYKIVISVKNPELILQILDDEMDCTVGIVSRNLVST